MKRFLLLTLAMAALFACRKAPIDDIEQSHDAITLQFDVSQSSIVETRIQSAAEMTLNNAWLFVFNSSGIMLAKVKATNVNSSARTANVALQTGSGINIYVCANVSSAQEAIFNGLVRGTTTIANLKAITADRSQLTAPGLPMWGELLNQTITAATTSLAIPLTRSCSRLDVVANAIPNFTLYGIEKLLKTSTNAPIFPGGSLVAASSTTDVVPTNKTADSIYLYENAIVAPNEMTAEGKATSVIIKGNYKGIDGYYKLRVQYSSPLKYDIGRNVFYTLNITGVKAPGFATLAEAEANYPQNVTYNVTSSDDQSTDLVVSNGQYYLGVSNSEYVAYNSDTMQNAVVATIVHNAPSSITSGTITATGAGLTLKTPTISTTTQTQDIVVDLAQNFTTGTLTLRLGNLIKVINLTKKATFGSSGGTFTDFSATAYVQGDLGESPTWFKFGKSASVFESAKRVVNPSGGIWLSVDKYLVGPAQTRTCVALISSTDRGRTRVYAKQKSAVLAYVSGLPVSKMPAVNPMYQWISVKTDISTWYIKAYEGGRNDKTKTVDVSIAEKKGSPSPNNVVDASIYLYFPDNTGPERTIHLYLVCSEFPGVELWFGSFIQAVKPTTISLSNYRQNYIASGGQTFTITLTASSNWIVGGAAAGSSISPTQGGAGTYSVTIIVPLNPERISRHIRVIFSLVGDYNQQVTWLGSQERQPDVPAESYIPRSVLVAAGWPAADLPGWGLQVATRGYRILPGGTPETDDPRMPVKGESGDTPGGRKELGQGLLNTSLVAYLTGFPAATYCRSLGEGWYLPSVYELQLIYNNQRFFGYNYLFSGQNKYWSSSADNSTYQYTVNFNGGLSFLDYKVYPERIRCVRNI